MSDDHDDLLNFEIADGDFAEGTLNEDELLLSDEDRDDFDDEPAPAENSTQAEAAVEATPTEPETTEDPPESSALTDEPADTGQVQEKPKDVPSAILEKPAEVKVEAVVPQNAMPPRQPFRQKFQRWPNQGGPRWNNHPMGPQQQQMPPFQRQSGPVMRMPGPGHMQGGPPQRQMRPGFPPQQRPPFFNNNFMHGRPPMQRQRFFYPNSGPMGGDSAMQGSPGYVPTPIMAGNSGPGMPRKVLINPNFKGGVEAAKNQLLKDQFFSSSSIVPEDELLRKQQEFINHNMRQIEKRRHERTPSPEYRRGYSHSPSPTRYRRRGAFRNNDRRRDSNGNDGKGKDENQPEEDEETRAYRQQIESQRKKREEILRQKEMRRRQQAEKAKETQPTEPLQPIVVTDKKIVLKRKTPDRSTTPPIKEAPITPTRRIVLKPSKEGKDGKPPLLEEGSKRKIRKILNS